MDVGEQGIAAAIALGLTEACTRAGLPSRFAPLVSMLLAVIVSIGLAAERNRAAVVVGLLAGLAASGAYSGTKAVMGK